MVLASVDSERFLSALGYYLLVPIAVVSVITMAFVTMFLMVAINDPMIALSERALFSFAVFYAALLLPFWGLRIFDRVRNCPEAEHLPWRVRLSAIACFALSMAAVAGLAVAIAEAGQSAAGLSTAATVAATIVFLGLPVYALGRLLFSDSPIGRASRGDAAP